ncbi:hypothetical protein [Nitratireductor soli]|uniref:hypothetical protein n=1 Tax=Nitratireductor soli TaxID=1670619 RepID=UPI00065E35BA|nr:hypothetical protein [Nitratireductor soli]
MDYALQIDLDLEIKMKSRVSILFGLLSSSFACAAPAYAASESVPFYSEVQDSCTITLDSPGVMAAEGFFKLSSKAGSGGAGRVDIFTTGRGFNVSTAAPSAFVRSPAGVGPTTFSSSYSATGATSLANVPGLVISALGHGYTKLSVDLTAETTGVVFPSGAYQADVTVTCE